MYSFAIFFTYCVLVCLEDMESFRSNVIYWLLTVFIVLAYTTVLCTFSALGHILSCSLLGSFAFVAALSHYVGANLQYIAVNMFRRITIENFNLAMVDPPYQVKGKYIIMITMYIREVLISS